MVKCTLCDTIQIHVFEKSVFIHNFKIILVPNEHNFLCKTSLTDESLTHDLAGILWING